MRNGTFTTFMVAVFLLVGSLLGIIALPNGYDFGFTMNAAAAPPFSGGDGSVGNPFQISNVSQLQNMSADLTAHYILINDIDCAETSSWNTGLGFLPIGGDQDLGTGGFQGAKFTGSLNGQGDNITDLYINQPGYNWVGFFGWVEVGGEISNVSLKNVSVRGEGRSGGFIGLNKGNLNNCSVKGTVTGDAGSSWNVGGLIGENDQGSISYCFTDCIVNSYEYSGGLVGYNNGFINNSYSTGPMTGGDSEYIGGLVGYNPGTINNSYATGNVVSSSNSVGGFVGDTFGYVFNSYATGSVSGNQYVGGFAGESVEVIRNCYATGAVNGVTDVGGFAGYNDDRINNSYSTGLVTGTTSVGGFIGWQTVAAATTGCYFDNITTGKTTGVGGGTVGGTISRNTTDMKKQATFMPASWDFSAIWGIIEDNSYPFLRPFYNPPRLITQNIGIAVEDTIYSHDLVAYYSTFIPGNEIIWSFKTNTGTWLSLSFNGVLSGTPTNDDVGTPWVDVKVTDLVGDFESFNFSLPILNVNDPPTINTANVKTATEDVVYNVDYDAIDIDPTSDVLTWNLTTDADWLAFNISSGNLSGTPENADVGKYWIRINVNDGKGGSDSTEFFLDVQNVNDDPIITTTQVPTKAKEDKLYIVGFDAVDEDPTNDVITWGIDKDANWLTFNASSAVLFGTPGNEDVGVYDINITVTDGNGGSDWFDYELTVVNVNDPPKIITSDITTGKVDELYSNEYNATDIDLPGDILTWSLSTNASSWLSINTTSGLLNGTPGDDQDGSYWVNVMVSDGNGGSDSHNFTLVVKPKPEIPPVVNKDPEITTKDVLTAEVDEEYSVVYAATDDRTNVVDLIWTVNSNASWLEFNPTTNTLSGTPSNSDVGSYWVEITVSDGENGTDSHNFTVSVPKPPVIKPEPKNNPPTITQITEEQKVKAGDKYSVKVTGADQDEGDIITFSLQNKPGGMVISKDGEILWLPQDNQVGTHTVVVALSDGENTSTMSFNVIVEEKEKVEPEEPEKEKVTEFGLEEGMPYLIILLIIGLIIGLLIGMAMARKKKPAEELEEEEPIEEEEPEETETETEEEKVPEEELEDEELEEEEPEEDVPEDEVSEDELEEEKLGEEELEDEELEDEEMDEDELEE